ncbi:MAG TPA: DUF3999 family protein [Burkholderiaceae bacterium]|nr:DUF3999 family protein [Burkholderiaceae bacterium]
MRPRDRHSPRHLSPIRAACGIGVAWLATVWGSGVAAAADEPPYRHEAAIAVQRSAPFVELALPAEAYARSRQDRGIGEGLRDLRIVDARGERVPFAWLPPRADDTQTHETLREARLYPLPARPAADGTWRAPIAVVIEGDRLSVRRAAGRTAAQDGEAVSRSGGWIVDLGERTTTDAPPDQLRLAWSGPAEFSALFDLASSDDLRSWRPGGAGQVVALQSGGVPLTQPNVTLAPGTGRFVRLVWADAATAPALSGAQAVTTRRDRVARDAPVELTFAAQRAAASNNGSAARALDFDLGGVLPVAALALQWNGAGTQIAPVRLQGRNGPDDPWRELGGAVFYRVARTGSVSESPPFALRTEVRFVRVTPDERAAALDAAQTRLRVRAPLAHLVFASQGQPPYRLQVGAADASSSALTLGTLVPSLADERERFGVASAGEWTEIAAAARRDEALQRQKALRPWLLWAVLLAGVAALGFIVWRLARSAPRTG